MDARKNGYILRYECISTGCSPGGRGAEHNDGSRPLFQAIWKAAVPPKVKIFAWRLSQEGLATQTNKKARTLEEAICQVCGREDDRVGLPRGGTVLSGSCFESRDARKLGITRGKHVQVLGTRLAVTLAGHGKA
jgi:hypothetical protein